MRLASIFLFSLTLFFSACNSESPASSIAAKSKPAEMKSTTTKTGFIHTVFFWMKDGFDETKKTRFEAGLKKLAKVPSIKDVYWGPPAGTDREVVDNSYDYAWIVHFANKEDQDKYQVDPIHLKFIEECKDIWDKVIVYDSLVE